MKCIVCGKPAEPVGFKAGNPESDICYVCQRDPRALLAALRLARAELDGATSRTIASIREELALEIHCREGTL